MSMVAKTALSFDDIDAQTAVELPDRESLLVTVVITNVLNDLNVEVTVQNIQIAAQICAAILAVDTAVNCEVVVQQ
jgi:hypothetical protein